MHRLSVACMMVKVCGRKYVDRARSTSVRIPYLRRVVLKSLGEFLLAVDRHL